MCRICGRMFKCVLDSMPSRTPSSILRNTRSFTQPLRPKTFTPQTSKFSTFSTAFTRPSLFSSISTARPQLPSSTTPTAPSLSSHFSTSASLGAKRDTYNPSRKVQKRRSGFLSRVRTRTGRALLARRRAKGRKDLSY